MRHRYARCCRPAGVYYEIRSIIVGRSVNKSYPDDISGWCSWSSERQDPWERTCGRNDGSGSRWLLVRAKLDRQSGDYNDATKYARQITPTRVDEIIKQRAGQPDIWSHSTVTLSND